ncbi:MAG: hypothetical protein VX910_10655, partial [Candidatus Latescibacterota bacterium]|nr:hypothetical protein [Candidatus Latescibacterota bacterium]
MNKQGTSSLVGPSIIAVMLIVIPLLITSESNHLGYYAKLLWLHAGLVVLAAFVPRGQRHFSRSPISLPLAAFLLANTISIIQSVNRISTLVTLSHRLALLTTFVLFISTINRKHIGKLVTTIGITSGVTSAIGIAQYAGWFGLDFPSSGMPSSTFGYRNFAAA